jgi:hypothetical protein
MKRKTDKEILDAFKPRREEERAEALRKRLNEWAEVVGESIGVAEPALPDGVTDRQAEIWEPLVAVADAVSGDWPERARKACKAFCTVSRERKGSLAVRLLADLIPVFGNSATMFSKEMVDKLREGGGQHDGIPWSLDDDAPWSRIKGEPLTQRYMAYLLAKYGVRPIKVNIGGIHLQGYRRADLWEQWERYLPALLTTVRAEPSEPNSVPVVPDIRGGVGGNGVDLCPSCADDGPPGQCARRSSLGWQSCLAKAHPELLSSSTGHSTSGCVSGELETPRRYDEESNERE